MNRIVKQPLVTLPDGCAIRSYWIVNGAGARIGKISADTREESEDSIKDRAIVAALATTAP